MQWWDPARTQLAPVGLKTSWTSEQLPPPTANPTNLTTVIHTNPHHDEDDYDDFQTTHDDHGEW